MVLCIMYLLSDAKARGDAEGSVGDKAVDAAAAVHTNEGSGVAAAKRAHKPLDVLLFVFGYGVDIDVHGSYLK